MNALNLISSGGWQAGNRTVVAEVNATANELWNYEWDKRARLFRALVVSRTRPNHREWCSYAFIADVYLYITCAVRICASHTANVYYTAFHMEKKRYQIKLNALDANESNNMLLPYGVCVSVHTPFTHKHKRFHIFPSSSFALFGPIHTLPRTAEGRKDHIYLYMRFERNKKYL